MMTPQACNGYLVVLTGPMTSNDVLVLRYSDSGVFFALQRRNSSYEGSTAA